METDWTPLAEEYMIRDFPKEDWVYGYQPVLDLLGNIKDKRILDYGCGSGKFSRKLVEKGAHVIGVEPNERMLTLAQEQNCKSIEYRLISNNNISFVDKVDEAVATFVLCSFSRDEDLQFVIEQVYQKLKPKGSFIILEPHPSQRQRKDLKQPVEVHLNGLSKPLWDYCRPIDSYLTLLQKVGFSIDSIIETENELKEKQRLVIKAVKNQI